MKKQPLSEFVAPRGQPEAARLLCLSQSAISSMLIDEREIYVTVDSEAVHGYSAFEIKPIRSIDRTGKRKAARKKSK